MIELVIKSQVDRAVRAVGHIKNGVPRVLAPAINRAAAKGKTEIKREIRKVYNIKAKDIPAEVHRATYGSLGAAIIVRQGMLDLNKFNYQPRFAPGGRMRRPLWAQVKKGGGGTIAGGFVADMPSGYSGPFIRAAGASRLPIHKLLSIGAGIMASQPSVGPAANKAMGDTMDKRLDHEIKRVLASAGGR
jgi:hypothetical protein